MCRCLKAHEIDVRVQSIKGQGETCKGAVLLLYKNARVDMDILDEEFGKLGWQRTHTFKDGKLYCTVSVWDREKQQWISREDVGTESNTEAEKGQASDSFKRANVNFGIGRELYTAPFTYVSADKFNYYNTGRKDARGNVVFATNDSFSVSDIVIEDKIITGLAIKNDNSGNIVFTFGKCKANTGSNSSESKTPKQAPTKTTNEPKTAPIKPVEALSFVVADGITVEMLFKQYKNDIDSIYESGTDELKNAIDQVRAYIKACKK